MTRDEPRSTLADQAATWVPPWARPAPAGVGGGTAEPAAAGDPAAGDPAGGPVPLDGDPGDPTATRDAAGACGGVGDPADAEPPSGEPVPPTGPPPADPAAGDASPEQDRRAEIGAETSTGDGQPGGVLDAEPGAAQCAGDGEPGGVLDGEPGAAQCAGHGEPGEVLDGEPGAAQDAGDGEPGEVPADGQPGDTPVAEPLPVALPVAEGDAVELDPVELRGALEAILLVVDEPVPEVTLAQVLAQPVDRLRAALAGLAEAYTAERRGFELRRAAGGWRLYTRGDYASYVERFVLDGQQARLTQAALETLAVVAYKQPVTRSRISAIRGVNCDGVVRTLVNRGLIEECGTAPETGALLYRTTSLFLEKLGLDNLDQLPDLAPFLPTDVDEIADAQS